MGARAIHFYLLHCTRYLGGDGAGDDVDLARIAVGIVLPPVGEHPVAQHRADFVASEGRPRAVHLLSDRQAICMRG